ncbi:MAG TPA: zf-HC2 domain-containing protein [bacterium]
MNNCRKCRSMFIEALYSELNLEQKNWFEAHLRSCPKCVEEYEKINSTVGVMNQRTRTEPGKFFWEGYWDKLIDRIEAEEKSISRITAWRQRFWQSFNFQPGWAYRVATAVALIAIGVFIGKLYFGRPVSQHVEKIQTLEVPPTAVEQVSLQRRTDQYIERSKVLLLGLINFDSDSEDIYALDMPYQKQISRELIQEANSLKEELNDPAQRQLRELIEDLKITLLQIANLESEHDLAGIDLVKSGANRRGILLKINLEEMQGSGASKQVRAEKGKI